MTNVDPRGRTLPCPLELEFLADGTVELNHLSDDSPSAACMFSRIPYLIVGSRVYIGPPGQTVAACLYSVRGESLAIACEDHRNPPTDLREHYELGRIAVRESSGLAAIAGRWRSTLSGGEPFEIASDGRLGPPVGPGQTVVVDAQRLELRRDSKPPELCLYRVTDRRLSLACNPVASGYPQAFEGSNVIVLVRD